jgi:hypothetical protein
MVEPDGGVAFDIFKVLIPKLESIVEAKRRMGISLGEVESIVIGGLSTCLLLHFPL